MYNYQDNSFVIKIENTELIDEILKDMDNLVLLASVNSIKLDLDSIEKLSCKETGKIIKIGGKLKKQNKKLVLFNVSDYNKEFFAEINLGKVFEIS